MAAAAAGSSFGGSVSLFSMSFLSTGGPSSPGDSTRGPPQPTATRRTMTPAHLVFMRSFMVGSADDGQAFFLPGEGDGPGLGGPCADDLHPLEGGQAGQLVQPLVGDGGAGQDKTSEPPRPFQPLQPVVGDLGAAQVERGQRRA